ncbi:MAG: bifunctional hydroxymethylpyrimidine kinase/phosphomethylpyrimidine kinase [Treponema sp.]|nr:bifunctional hydroxymethylpyrimidine kinase/phosphomethylpyrimidine kinase [Treponema sp.]
MKRICTVQDLSGVGKCSLSCAIPVLTSFGHEVCSLPTAVLSNHTAFDFVNQVDLTSFLKKTIEVWEDQHIRFDCIYTGYIRNKEQLEIIGDFIDSQKKHGAFVVVDPCMADHGKLYSGFDETFPLAMKELCKKANVILPNSTEGELLGGDLENLGPSVLLKGLSPSDDRTGISFFDAESRKTKTYFHKKYSENFFGTGDLFASYFTGSAMAGNGLWESACKAADFVEKCIAKTLENPEHRWYGTDFESVL